MGPDLLRFALLPASERWEMGETTSHPQVHDATPASQSSQSCSFSILALVLVIDSGAGVASAKANVVAFAHICFPERRAFDQQRQKLENENDDEHEDD